MRGLCITHNENIRPLLQNMGWNGDIAEVVDELFLKDEHLQYLCHVGLTKTLTRTADGGSDAIRVKELADMVKHLRKAVQTYQKKLQQLQAAVGCPPHPPGSADPHRSPCVNVETQTSPRSQGVPSTHRWKNAT